MSSQSGDTGTSQLLAYIHVCIDAGRYAIHSHALEYHPAEERFNARQGIEAIYNGTIIENTELQSKCLICGPAEGLESSNEFIGNYIHGSVAYNEIMQVVIITMYRPKQALWVDPYTRRR